MAVNTFTFGNITSSTYGIYVSGEGLFNAPVRSAEVISIPGRNGAYILDEGKFENITVTYRVFNQEKDLSNFRTKLANLRNALCSQIGYQRLTDTFHPNEYRMAAFIDGVEVKPVEYNTASEFEIKFECKPQRFLTSGETATTVANNGTLTNPTNFEAEPLLAVKGYGDINFNGYTVTLQNVVLGDITLIDSQVMRRMPYTYTIDTNMVNSSDTVNINTGLIIGYKVSRSDGTKVSKFGHSDTITNSNSAFSTTATGSEVKSQGSGQITVGTNKTITNTVSATLYFSQSVSPNTFAVTASITETIQYVASSQTITFSVSASFSTSASGVTVAHSKDYVNSLTITANSTASALGNPTYIDCSIGECYMIKNSEIISLNGVISLGSDLPKLSTGTNTFTMDNTITELKVTPNWWQV